MLGADNQKHCCLLCFVVFWKHVRPFVVFHCFDPDTSLDLYMPLALHFIPVPL